MASRDITYCVKECDDMGCKHNKKHIKEIVLEDGSHPAAGALNWWVYPECEKGEFKASFPGDPKRIKIMRIVNSQIQSDDTV